MGVEGTLLLAGRSIELHAEGAPVSIDIDLILNQWPLLPEDLRRRKADEIARRLNGAYRASLEVERRGGRGREGRPGNARNALPGGRILGALAGLFGLLAAIGLARILVPRLRGLDKVESSVPTESDVARGERLARACDAVRDRLYKGASFGPFALEGWTVELWLARSDGRGAPLREQPALGALVAGGKLAPAADAELTRIIDGTAEITDGFDADAAQRSPAWSAATVVFREGYARAFLEEESRPRFLALADRIATAAGADYAALYARCAHLRTHDVGAWFRGPDLAGAAAVMVYQIGLFAEAPVIDKGALATLRGPAGGELDALHKTAAGVEEAVPRLVGSSGGAVTTGHPATLVFPLAAPVRPLAATRALAHKMGIAVLAGD